MGQLAHDEALPIRQPIPFHLALFYNTHNPSPPSRAAAASTALPRLAASSARRLVGRTLPVP